MNSLYETLAVNVWVRRLITAGASAGLALAVAPSTGMVSLAESLDTQADTSEGVVSAHSAVRSADSKDEANTVVEQYFGGQAIAPEYTLTGEAIVNQYREVAAQQAALGNASAAAFIDVDSAIVEGGETYAEELVVGNILLQEPVLEIINDTDEGIAHWGIMFTDNDGKLLKDDQGAVITDSIETPAQQAYDLGAVSGRKYFRTGLSSTNIDINKTKVLTDDGSIKKYEDLDAVADDGSYIFEVVSNNGSVERPDLNVIDEDIPGVTSNGGTATRPVPGVDDLNSGFTEFDNAQADDDFVDVLASNDFEEQAFQVDSDDTDADVATDDAGVVE